jgi:outer membrane protein OmpA-like peptidoglycan-associated protein
MPSTHTIALAALLCVVAVSDAARAQGRRADPMAVYLEVAVDPVALMTLPIGSLESVRGNPPCSPRFSPATSVNLGLTLRGSMVFDPHRADTEGFRARALSFSLGYDDISSLFESSGDSSIEGYDPITRRYTPIRTRHDLEFVLRYLRVASEFELALGGGLMIRGGPSIGIPLSASSRESESVVSPDNATFPDRTQVREMAEGTGPIGELGLRAGICATLAFRLPLGARVFFEPAIGADYGLTPLQPAWSQLQVRGGIGIGCVLLPRREERMLPPVAASPPSTTPVSPSRSQFNAAPTIDVASGTEPITFRRQIVARYVPLLHAIFFDRNGAEIPARYSTQGPAGFREDAVPGNAEAAHHLTLDIFGSRLAADPRVRLTITGTTSEDEDDRGALARRRAEAVARYLTGSWGIDPKRITIRSRLDPAVPSNREREEGRQENRRVEIDASRDEIYRPVQLRVVEPALDPSEIGFRLFATSTLAIERWRVEIAGGGAMLKRIDGTGEPQGSVRWMLSQDDRERVLSAGSVSYTLTVFDSAGRGVTSPRRPLPIRLDTTITVASSAGRPEDAAEFLLVTFDFDRAGMTRRGREELESILERVGPGSTVSVTGYTDRLGNVGHNRALATERARRVAASMPPDARVEYRGASPEEAPYAGSLPEGRFLSRTVRVVVTKPRGR